MRKDIEWLKEEIRLFQVGENMFTAEFNAGVLDTLEYVLDLLDELDESEVTEEQAWDIIKNIYGISNESFVRSVMRLVMEHVKDDTTIGEIREKLESEVLSSDWIDSHTDIVENNFTDEVYLGVRRNDLQNLLVPEQPFGNSEELPKIPKFVADWIEVERGTMSNWKLPSRFISDTKYKKDQRRYKWSQVEGNMDKFMSALINGYEVEEEQKFYVLGKRDTPILFRDYKNRITETSNLSDVYPKTNSEDFKFTEQEIKDYDERYFAFAKPVEELEE